MIRGSEHQVDGSQPQWAELVDPGSTPAFLDALAGLLPSAELFVLSHDLRTLKPLRTGSGTAAIEDPAVIETLLTCRTHRGEDHIVVPLCDRSFPLLAARWPATETPEDLDEVTLRAISTIAAHQLPALDGFSGLRKTRPMSTAAQLQWDQLPLRAARLGGFEVAGTLEPAFDVAGDLYDFALAPSGELVVLCMDAMGHGVTATLSAALALAAARTARRDGADLAEQVGAADEAVLGEFGGDRFVTMVALALSDDRIEVVNAGHEPLRRVTVDQTARQLEVPADPPLGLEGRTRYRTERIDPLAVNETMCVLSDGAVDCRDAQGEALGTKAVEAALTEGSNVAPLLLVHRFACSVLDYAGGDLSDDLTVVAIQRARESH